MSCVLTISEFTNGGKYGSLRPKLYLHASSTVFASAMPRSTIEIASRHNACCILFAMNPGTSFFTKNRFLSSLCQNIDHCLSNLICGSICFNNFYQRNKECRVPEMYRKVSRCLHFAEISVGLITDVFVQKIQSSAT